MSFVLPYIDGIGALMVDHATLALADNFMLGAVIVENSPKSFQLG
ncbi:MULTISPECIES: hypothetical protein [unclassified Mesorhizobium]|nr:MULTISPECIES: hypothetical protein [unclassified Mesorhizobium]